MADSKRILEIIRAMGLKMEEQKDYLTELDQPIGDSDMESIWPGDLERWRRSSPPLRAKISEPYLRQLE